MIIKKLLINLIPIKSKRKELRKKYVPHKDLKLEISSTSKCLMVCPHPDDEMLGAGGVMIKYAKNFDCICMASAGVKTPQIEAEPRADIRIKEFAQVMQAVGIKNHKIFKTFGIPPMCDQIESYFDDYCNALDTTQYDYIFLPHPKDAHIEHQYITNNIFKRILKKKGYKHDCLIVFYEVWQPLSSPNYYEDISEIAKKKFSCLEMYASQNGWINYPDRVEGLNKYRGMLFNNVAYAEAFKIIHINKYFKGKCK